MRAAQPGQRCSSRQQLQQQQPHQLCGLRRPGRARRCCIRATLDTTVRQLKTIINPQQPPSNYSDANFPVDAEGRTLHLGCKHGELANRILSVGSMDRALLIADQLQGPEGQKFQHLSGRGFLTVTGLFRGVPLSIVTTLMGMPNMDFVVREARAVVTGHMAIVRLGTCGALRPPARLGSFMVAAPGAVCVRCGGRVIRGVCAGVHVCGCGCACGCMPSACARISLWSRVRSRQIARTIHLCVRTQTACLKQQQGDEWAAAARVCTCGSQHPALRKLSACCGLSFISPGRCEPHVWRCVSCRSLQHS